MNLRSTIHLRCIFLQQVCCLKTILRKANPSLNWRTFLCHASHTNQYWFSNFVDALFLQTLIFLVFQRWSLKIFSSVLLFKDFDSALLVEATSFHQGSKPLIFHQPIFAKLGDTLYRHLSWFPNASVIAMRSQGEGLPIIVLIDKFQAYTFKSCSEKTLLQQKV